MLRGAWSPRANIYERVLAFYASFVLVWRHFLASPFWFPQCDYHSGCLSRSHSIAQPHARRCASSGQLFGTLLPAAAASGNLSSGVQVHVVFGALSRASEFAKMKCILHLIAFTTHASESIFDVRLLTKTHSRTLWLRIGSHKTQ